MSKMLLKILADMAGVKPEDIVEGMERFQVLAAKGIETLEEINTRLNNIENHLGISNRTPPQLTLIEANQNDDQGTGTG